MNKIFEKLNTKYAYDGETIIVSRALELLNDFDEALNDAAGRDELAKMLAKDCEFKEFIRIATYLTMNRLAGIKNERIDMFINDVLNHFKHIKMTYQKDFDWWVKMSTTSLSSLPIWNIEDIGHIQYADVEDEYISLAEICAVYYTCVDNPMSYKWCCFLEAALAYMMENGGDKNACVLHNNMSIFEEDLDCV